MKEDEASPVYCCRKCTKLLDLVITLVESAALRNTEKMIKNYCLIFGGLLLFTVKVHVVMIVII